MENRWELYNYEDYLSLKPASHYTISIPNTPTSLPSIIGGKSGIRSEPSSLCFMHDHTKAWFTHNRIEVVQASATVVG